MPLRTPDGYDPVAKHTIAWAGTPESVATQEATTALVDATVPAMKAALQAAFDREVKIARAAALVDPAEDLHPTLVHEAFIARQSALERHARAFPDTEEPTR